MISRDARIGFVAGALVGAGAACVLASSKTGSEALDTVRKTSVIVEERVRTLNELVGEIAQVASNTTRRLDDVSEVVEKNLISSILELGGFFRSFKSDLDRVFPDRVA